MENLPDDDCLILVYDQVSHRLGEFVGNVVLILVVQHHFIGISHCRGTQESAALVAAEARIV